MEVAGSSLLVLEALATAASSAAGDVRAARAERKREEYAKQWDAFALWCEAHGLRELPAAP